MITVSDPRPQRDSSNVSWCDRLLVRWGRWTWRRRFRQIVSPTGAAVGIDRSGMILAVSAGFEEVAGIRESDVVGSRQEGVLWLDAENGFREGIFETPDGRVCCFEVRMLMLETSIPTLISGFVILLEGISPPSDSPRVFRRRGE